MFLPGGPAWPDGSATSALCQVNTAAELFDQGREADEQSGRAMLGQQQQQQRTKVTPVYQEQKEQLPLLLQSLVLLLLPRIQRSLLSSAARHRCCGSQQQRAAEQLTPGAWHLQLPAEHVMTNHANKCSISGSSCLAGVPQGRCDRVSHIHHWRTRQPAPKTLCTSHQLYCTSDICVANKLSPPSEFKQGPEHTLKKFVLRWRKLKMLPKNSCTLPS